MQKYLRLRKKYPRFVYKAYGYKIFPNGLKIFFDFYQLPGIKFRPELEIRNVSRRQIKKMGEKALSNLVFHLGLAEIPSYWKAACSREISIEAGPMDEYQINWWRNLMIKGMGQFFYQNKINFRKKDFLEIKASQKGLKPPLPEVKGKKYLVPVGGGKDSIVTLELLKKRKKDLNGFAVNPDKAVKDVLKEAGIENPVTVKRKIDPVLLKMNKKGFLNGHTPFTCTLSFLAVFCAALFNYKNVAFSNEKSADEGNLRYLGKTINHQYSKSSEFEENFRKYCSLYLVKNLNYFSFLRKYSELEIAEIFSDYPRYFPVFSSCNSKKEKWCLNCPKCLFSYLILCPYLERKQLLKIFKKDLLKEKNLEPVLKDMLGEGKGKPFECVGTFKEARKALKLCKKKNHDS